MTAAWILAAAAAVGLLALWLDRRDQVADERVSKATLNRLRAADQDPEDRQ